MNAADARRAAASSRAALANATYVFAPIALGSAGISVLLLWEPGGAATAFWNAAGPLIYGIALFGLAYQMTTREPLMLWTPFPWLLAACGAYFGVGPLLYAFGRPETVRYVDYFYPVAHNDLLRLQILNSLGVMLVLLGGLAAHTFSVSKTRISWGSSLSVRAVALLFLLIGVPIRYFLDVPAELGLLPFVLPGSIKLFGAFSALAIVPLSALALQRRGCWKWLLGLLLIAELASAAVQLSKLAFLTPMLLLFLGFWYVRPSKALIFQAGVGAGLIYLVTVPLAVAGRIGLTEETGFSGGVALPERVSILGRAVQVPREQVRVQHAWSRLNYATAQSYALARHDQGYPGQSFEALAFVFVPRVIWPTKPIVSDVGREFNREVTGNPDTSSAPGLFAEAYWNGGWPGVIIACLVVGVILGMFGRFAVQRIAAGDLLLLPVVFIGIKAGFRPDGWAIIEYAGAPGLAIVLLGVLVLARGVSIRALTGRRSTLVLSANGPAGRP